MTIDAGTLWAAILGLGVPVGKVGPMLDREYRPATTGWLTDEFHRYFQRQMDALEIKWSDDERADCNQATLLFRAFAVMAHARTPEGKGGALPVFGLTLRPDATKGDFRAHTAVLAYTSDRQLIVIEPQVVGRVLNYTVEQFGTAEHLAT